MKTPVLFVLLLMPFSILADETGNANDVAKELSNPNTSLASMTFKMQFREFEGDLPGADKQSSTTLLFQPSLPFQREDGSKIILRPAIPAIINQPVSAGAGNWNDETGFGDISFDLAYAFAPEKDNPGQIRAVGLFSSLPTGDKNLGMGETTTLGPEFLYGQTTKEDLWLVFPGHQWDIGGDVDVSLTTAQASYFRFAPGGWVYGTSSIMSYNHNAKDDNELTLPLNFTVSKTSIIGGSPWKFGAEINYYVEKPDDFGPEWMLSFSITPVIKNPFTK